MWGVCVHVGGFVNVGCFVNVGGIINVGIPRIKKALSYVLDLLVSSRASVADMMAQVGQLGANLRLTWSQYIQE